MQPSDGDAHDVIPQAQNVETVDLRTTKPVASVETRETNGSTEEGASSEESMSQLLAVAEQEYRSFRRGETIEGSVVSVERDGILVDVGTKSEGVIPSGEAQRLIDDNDVAVGDVVSVVVVQSEDSEGRPVLSFNRARSERGWRTLQAKYEAGTVFSVRVVEVNRGGLVAEADGVRGFIPVSQIAGVRVNGVSGDDLERALSAMVGRELAVKVIEVNRQRNRLILSERVAAQELREKRRDQLLAELQEGEVRHGRVSSICDFGAFVDLGGADGLVHLSELAWHQVGHPSEILNVGDEIDVMVLGVDRDRRKISLSLRRTQAEPWETAAERYPVGSLVPGRITRLTTFGAFARLEDGIEGLIHVSELSDHHVVHPRNVVKEGDDVTLRVLRVEPERRRLGLSLRQVEQAEDLGDIEPSND